MDFELVKWENKYLHDFIDATSDPHLTDNMCEVLPCPMDTAFAAEYIRERMLNSEECQICRAVVSDGRLVGGVDVIFGTGLFQKNADFLFKCNIFHQEVIHQFHKHFLWHQNVLSHVVPPG